MRTLVSAFALGGLLLAATTWADTPIYKWIDSQGVVHYSTEPHGSDSKPISVVNTGNGLPNPSTAPAAASASGKASADASLVMPQPADSPACKAGRDRLFRYLHADSLYQVDSSGQKQKLSVEDMQKALDEARDYVQQACGPGGGQ